MINKSKERQVFRAQKGFQQAFQACRADIGIGGGAAASGKTHGLLMEPTRFFHINDVNAGMFRRSAEAFQKPGSIWHEAQRMYRALGMTPNKTYRKFNFSRGSELKFDGLLLEDSIYNFQGSQYDFIGFDEMSHFTEEQFWYMVGRLRNARGTIKPYFRGTCNPDKGWLFRLVEWWIDPKTFYPIPERAGVLRWLVRESDVTYWFDSENQAWSWIKQNEIDERNAPQSFTFIPGTLNDNQILLKNDPSYYRKLASLPEELKQQMLYGRWFFEPKGKLFKPEWFQHFVIEPRKHDVVLITADTASSTKTANDYTVFQVWIRHEGKIYLLRQIRGKFTANEQLSLLTNLIINTQAKYVSIEKASTGFHLIQEIVKETGVLLLEMTRSKDKYNRAYDIQEYIERGYVYVNPTADYYADFISECANFAPENKSKIRIHDDQVDAMVDACYHLLIKKIGYNLNFKIKPTYIAGRKNVQ